MKEQPNTEGIKHSIETITDFVNGNIIFFKVPTEHKDRYRVGSFDCVDGRGKELSIFRVPGGTLGLMMSILAGITTIEKKLGRGFSSLTGEGLLRKAEGVFGGTMCHTDTHALEDGKDMICAGCGHCNGALMSEEYKDEYAIGRFRQGALDFLESKKKTVEPKILEGEHKEGAVVVIKSEPNNPENNICSYLPSTDGYIQMFVFHEDEFKAALAYMAKSLYGELAELAEQGITKERFVEEILQAGNRQLGATLERLAKGLPVFNVSKEGVVTGA